MWIDAAASFQKCLAALPLTSYQTGETVLADGSRTDQLLILRKGNVAVLKDGIEIARVTEPGAVFGEISALLDCPHTAEVRALAPSEFHVAHPAARHGYAVQLKRRHDLEIDIRPPRPIFDRFICAGPVFAKAEIESFDDGVNTEPLAEHPVEKLARR